MPAHQSITFPEIVTSVGALVVQGQSLLVARMTYGPNRGSYMLPGGTVESGEMPEVTVVRQVREEAGLATRPLGIIGDLSILYNEQTHAYLLWLMEPVGGEVVADGTEVDHCCFLSFNELGQRDDVADLVKYLVERLRDGEISSQVHADDFVRQFPGIPWKLFM